MYLNRIKIEISQKNISLHYLCNKLSNKIKSTLFSSINLKIIISVINFIFSIVWNPKVSKEKFLHFLETL